MGELSRDQYRRLWAVTLNLVAPGAGLVMLQRPWAGISLCLLFALLSQLALWGFLLVPTGASQLGSTWAALAAVAVWAFAQRLAVLRGRDILGPEARARIELLRTGAQEALERRHFGDAHELLRIALDIDDEDLQVQLQWARLVTLMGQRDAAHRAWKCVLLLDRCGEHKCEAVGAIDGLPR